VERSYSDAGRKIVHIAGAGFALLFRFIPWELAALLALAAFAFNALILHRIAPFIIRPSDAIPTRAGILLYPLSILVLVLLLPHRLDIVAAAWGVLAVGDGFATLAGKAIGRRRLPWNREKSWVGFVAFFVPGSAAAAALGLWVTAGASHPSAPFTSVHATLAAAIVAAVASAFVESYPIRLDDNVSVPLTAAGVLWFAAQVDRSGEPLAMLLDAATGIALSAPVAYLAWKVGRITTAGVAAGLVFAALIYAGLYVAGLAVVGVALALTILASRAAGADRGERRSADNILANCLVGTLGAAIEIFSTGWRSETAAVWFVAGIAAGASDTVASEFGKAFGGTTRAFPTFRRVSPGTPGAFSIIGTLAGIVAALAIAAPAAGLWLISWRDLIPIAMGCTCGAFVESALATAFEADGVLDNNTLNVLNTGVASIVAVALLG